MVAYDFGVGQFFSGAMGQLYPGGDTLCLFLVKEECTTNNFIKSVKAPIEEKKPMRVFSPEELHKILHSFNRDTFCGRRNHAMVLTFFATGIRLTELLNLKIDDINFQTDFLYIDNGKMQKSRFVPVSRTLKKILKEYIRFRDDYFDSSLMPWLFVTINGTKLSRDAIHTVFRDLKKDLKIPGEKVNPHALRHSFATYYVKGNGDIFSLQKILGHETLDMTKKYLQLSQDDVKTQFLQHNPADNLKWLY